MSHTDSGNPYDLSPLSGESAWKVAVTADSTQHFAAMIESLRKMQDRVAGSNPPVSEIIEVTKRIDEIERLLSAYQVPYSESVAGHLDVPGRGQSMAPAFVVEDGDDDNVHGRVSFSRFYLGGGGAVHGGAIPLVFDEVLGRLANAGGRTRSRTAYLHVNYRAITPLDRELRLAARFDREEGRKRYLTAELRDGDTLLADAEGLFVSLRPGQP
ncbi:MULTISPECIES: hotdog domain-containing protein [Nocardia]|uniref:hotdog domain-containing protein n=1 Tax=Nocardia TaxID=1817 RepID=UPI001E39C747|nr:MULTISPECIES: hotdog domain-containing protein [Nocardia]